MSVAIIFRFTFPNLLRYSHIAKRPRAKIYTQIYTRISCNKQTNKNNKKRINALELKLEFTISKLRTLLFKL